MVTMATGLNCQHAVRRVVLGTSCGIENVTIHFPNMVATAPNMAKPEIADLAK